MQPMSAILASAEKKQVCPMPQLTNIIYIKKKSCQANISTWFWEGERQI